MRLMPIDGLRGLAASCVVFYHCWLQTHWSWRLHLWLLPFAPDVLRPVIWLRQSVNLFLVISGFCLFLPMARNLLQGQSPTDWRTFAARRAWRLLPAYYVSILVALLAAGPIAGTPEAVSFSDGFQWATHLTMTHTLFFRSFHAINGVYWSLGLEAQFYLFMFVLVAGFRRLGALRATLLTLAISLLFRYGIVLLDSRLTHGQAMVAGDFFLARWAEFAFGMLLAWWYCVPNSPRPAAWNCWQRLGALAGALALCMLADRLAATHPLAWPWLEACWGFAAAVLVWLALEPTTLASRLLSLPFAQWVGRISYSLYLLHFPVLWLYGRFGPLLKLPVAGGAGMGLMMVICYPISLACAAWFYKKFEQPFLHGKPTFRAGNSGRRAA